MQPPAILTNQKGKPWPAYFLVRTTGEVVPLIAVDELPSGADLIGVPRSLDLKDTIGMLNLGLQRSSGAFYQILGGEGKGGKVGKTTATISDPPSSTPERTLLQSSTTSPITPPKATLPSSRVQARPTSTIAHSPQTQLQNQPQAHPQTQLCRHWCHHGICKWGQQCRYRHIMPMNTPGLQEVGLSDWPMWFRRMNPGYFAAEEVTLSVGVNGSAGRVEGGARGRRAKVQRCMSAGGNGGAFCGVLHGPGGVGGSGGSGGRVVRERNRIIDEAALGSVKERGAGRVLKSEELGEQIIARLRGMNKEHTAKEKATEKAGDRLSSSSLVERVAARDTKTWEDESENDDNAPENEYSGDEKEDVGKGKGKLVDV